MGISDEQPMQAMYWHQPEKFEPSIPGGLSPNIPEHQAIQWSSTHSYYGQQQPQKDEKRCPNNNVQVKTETPVDKPELKCGGCGMLIQERYYLSAVDKVWHADCLKCVSCCRPLAASNSCFSKGNMIYCREDYFKLYGCRRCGRCSAVLSSQEMVLRARDLVYHIDCFTCRRCEVKLEKGDTFGIVGSDVFCQQHYQSLVQGCDPSMPAFHQENQCVSSPTCQNAMMLQSPPPPLMSVGGTGFAPFMPFHPGVLPNHMYPTPGMEMQGLPVPQKGRPRKRRTKLETIGDPTIDPYASDSNFEGSCQQQRTKRMRTSFKHHQLRMLKTYFQTNHNPDAKDLKQLSQKTGLSKRVLQVWFQNARAKWRRLVQKTDHKPDENSSENLSGDEASCSMYNEDPGSDTVPASYEYLS